MINNFRDKQARIKIMQKKADQYNQRFDDLEEKGEELNEIPKIIEQENKEKRHEQVEDEEPYLKNGKAIGMTGRLGQGYENAHKIKSQASRNNQTIEQQFNSYKEEKKKGRNPTTYLQNKDKQAAFRAERKEQIYETQVHKLFDTQGEMVNRQTEHAQHYVYDQHMLQIHLNRDIQHHQKKNDLKWYTEEFVKCKDFLRKC